MTTRNTINIIFIIVKQFFVLTFNSTFNLPDLDFILKGVKGNGKTLGFTNGTDETGLAGITAGNSYSLGALRLDVFDKNIGTTTTNTFPTVGMVSYGLIENDAKSGIESVIDININYFIKY